MLQEPAGAPLKAVQTPFWLPRIEQIELNPAEHLLAPGNPVEQKPRPTGPLASTEHTPGRSPGGEIALQKLSWLPGFLAEHACFWAAASTTEQLTRA